MTDSILLCPVGDSHNFGRRVSVCRSYEGLSVMKPRSVFWEHMFLDGQSSYRQFIRNLAGSNLDMYMGSLKISGSKNFASGEAEFCEKKDSEIEDLVDSLFLQNIGRLIAFATIYGLTDLHIENLLIKESRIQLLDIECVFASIESCLDTLLIPSQKFSQSKSVLSKLANIPLNFLIENLVRGLCEEFIFFRNHSKFICEFHRNNIDVYKNIPIRFLFRSSKEYADECRIS